MAELLGIVGPASIARTSAAAPMAPDESAVSRLTTTAPPPRQADSETSDPEADAQARRAHEQAIRDEVLALVEQENPRVALTRLRALMKDDPALLRTCHPFMHQIGQRAYVRYGSFAEAAQYRDDLCNSGYLHGVIEGHFSTTRDPLNSMKTLCAGYEPNKYASWQCYHGIGHGLMFFKRNDLPAVLALCNAYELDFARGTCANGAYMENFNAEDQLHPSRYRSADAPFYPCDLEGLSHRSACYLYAPAYYLALHKGDYEGALRLCRDAERQFRSACTRGVGSQSVKENIDDPHVVERLCDAGEAWQHRPCIRGMVSLFANHHGALEPVEQFCTTLRADNQPICADVVKGRRGFF